jgi:hypothetical protein
MDTAVFQVSGTDRVAVPACFDPELFTTTGVWFDV